MHFRSGLPLSLHHVQRDCALPLRNRAISIVSFKGNTTTTKLPRGRFQRAPFRGLCRFASWPSVVPGAGRIINVTKARVIKTNPTTPVVDLMVEKIPFTAPFAADVTQRWIRDLAGYREPRLVVYPTTVPICVASAGSRCFKAFAAFGLCCGMKAVGD